MKVNKIFDGIIEIEDFVSKEDCNSITSFANSIAEDEWFKEKNSDYTWWQGKVLSISGMSEIKELKDVYIKVENLFTDALEITGINLNRFKKDDFLGYHNDEWLNHPKYFIKYGIVIYYNDDYDGGELHYKDLDFTYKPKAGSLIIHGGDKLHGTLPVKSNSVRYSSTIFVKESRKKSISLNKEVFEGINEL